jgi:hypothetical protein
MYCSDSKLSEEHPRRDRIPRLTASWTLSNTVQLGRLRRTAE